MEDMTTQVTELKLSVDGLEKERDFYFGKLRDIEILLQSVGGEDGSGAVGEKGPQLVQQIFKILYATEDDFVIVDVSCSAWSYAGAVGSAAVRLCWRVVRKPARVVC